jgi:16S rRNA (guanine966-N2)-methyltransferase
MSKLSECGVLDGTVAKHDNTGPVLPSRRYVRGRVSVHWWVYCRISNRKVKRKSKKANSGDQSAKNDARETDVRIIGGEFRGRRLTYHGDTIVRPMKHRTREAIFNLISTECAGTHAIDLFAGTGALGLEALSRGASRATLIEKHVPTARVIEANIHALGVEHRATLVVTSAFVWGRRDLPNLAADLPWLVFCSPPYAFFHERTSEMLDLVGNIQRGSPVGSIIVVEADAPFDFEAIRSIGSDEGNAWDMRAYAPAMVGLWRKR